MGRVFKTWRTQAQQLAWLSGLPSRQTAVRETGAGWHSRHFSTSIKPRARGGEGAREGGTGGGLPLSLRLPPPRVPPGPAPSAGRRRDAASGWVGRPRHPETLPQHRASNLLLLGPRSATPQNGESRDGDPHPTPQLLTGPDRTKQQECLAQGPTRSRRCVHVCVCASGLQDAHSVVGLEGRDLPLAGVRRG